MMCFDLHLIKVNIVASNKERDQIDGATEYIGNDCVGKGTITILRVGRR